MRVGFWRFEALFRRLKIRPTLALNARVCVDYPRVAQACKDAGWEFMGHSYEQGPIHKEEDQPGMIRRSIDTIRKFTGKRAGRLARAGPHADAGHARAPRRRGHQVHRRLGLRRRADRDPDRPRPARHPALFSGDQRHPDDAGAAPRGGLLDEEVPGFLRALLRGRQAARRRSWRSPSTPTSAGSRSASSTWKRSTRRSTRRRACCTGTASRSSTGT